MTFLRPELRRWLIKWAEPLITGAACLIFVWLYFRADAAANAALQVVAFVALAGGIALLLVAIRRVRLHSDKQGAGLVEIEERKITYYGPDEGGVISLDDLRRIDIVSARTAPFVDTLYWRLSDHEGVALNIPVGAAGTDQMIDSFAALSGVNYDLILTAMAARDSDVFTIWRKPQ